MSLQCHFSQRRALNICHLGRRVISLKKKLSSFLLASSRLSFAGVLCALTPAFVYGQAVPGVLMQPPSAKPVPGQTATQQLPNTVSAPPFTVRDKFDYRVIQTFGFRGLVGAAVASGFAQATDSPGKWGQDFPGYAQRYATAFAGNLTRQVFAFGIESALHEDPRYFPLDGNRGFKARTVNALKQVVWTRTDNGGSSFAYARIASAFGSSQIIGLALPDSDASFGDGLARFGYTLAADAGYNFLQEFVPRLRPRSLRHRH
jgi:hypothetical protein